VPAVAEAPKKGHGTGSRERRLRAQPHWVDIEQRLQHRWSPERVADWYAKAHPTEPPISSRTLRRFVEDQPESWFVTRILLEQSVKDILPAVMVRQRLAEILEMQFERINGGRSAEKNMQGLMYPEMRANIALAAGLLKDYAELEQGPREKGAAAGRPTDDSSAEARERAELVHRVVNLSEQEFIPVIVQLLGPPPVKQPISIEGTVLESRPLTEEERDA